MSLPRITISVRARIGSGSRLVASLIHDTLVALHRSAVAGIPAEKLAPLDVTVECNHGETLLPEGAAAYKLTKMFIMNSPIAVDLYHNYIPPRPEPAQTQTVKSLKAKLDYLADDVEPSHLAMLLDFARVVVSEFQPRGPNERDVRDDAARLLRDLHALVGAEIP